MKKYLALLGVLCIGLLLVAPPASARDADLTNYPIVFAHGMAGFDDILGYDYWGDDYGVFVLDPCDGFLETSCNGDINDNQKSFVASVTPFHDSYTRGYELYQDIRNYMASSGASYINLVGHSQGGLDMRKAAKLLYDYYGYTVVKFGVSISSPHRGSPVAKYILDLGPGVDDVLSALANYYGDIVYGSGNDAYAAAKQLVYDDYEIDGKYTGCYKFNQYYPRSSTYISYSRSFITTQDGLSLNPALYLLVECFYDIDGDGYATYDANGDGAEGTGDGTANDCDDDGLVGLNSQQMGYRLEYDEVWGVLDYVYVHTDTGYCADLNAPDYTMMTSHKYAIEQDHLDVIGVGPDLFDEMEFYAALTDYIADSGM